MEKWEIVMVKLVLPQNFSEKMRSFPELEDIELEDEN